MRVEKVELKPEKWGKFPLITPLSIYLLFYLVLIFRKR